MIDTNSFDILILNKVCGWLVTPHTPADKLNLDLGDIILNVTGNQLIRKLNLRGPTEKSDVCSPQSAQSATGINYYRNGDL